MTGQDWYQALDDSLRELDEAIGSMRVSGHEYAKAKREYRKALALKIAELRFDKSYPVTLVPDLARGDADVAQAGYLRDMWHVDWEADRFNVERLRTTSWIIQKQFEMEARGR